ncbi:hypothetical protein Pla86_47210 [Planctomycetes bacterium Pla86]|nr:hypothetical protein Pla86_47210 [Planctomycetes bacterium Pla86]
MFDCLLSSPNTLPFMNTLGQLDELGRAMAAIGVAAGAPGLAGMSLDFAFATLDPSQGGSVTSVSNTARVDRAP